MHEAIEVSHESEVSLVQPVSARRVLGSIWHDPEPVKPKIVISVIPSLF